MMKLLLIVFILSLYISCTTGTRCNDLQHPCGDGACVDQAVLCNGFYDCHDGSDETAELCSNRPCSSAMEAFSSSKPYRCDYGGCIPRRYVCNGVINCPDGSDETRKMCQNESCRDLDFKCGYGACLSYVKMCDNIKNCADGTDETAEACIRRKRKCNSKQYKCSYGSCISKERKCDGVVDCFDGSDENSTLCGYPVITTPPPVVIPPTSLPDVCTPGDCKCPSPVQHVCVPCDQKEKTCSILDKNDICQITPTPGMSVDVLSCGVENSISICSNSNKVPVLSIVQVHCWHKQTSLLQCRHDGLWYYYLPSKSSDFVSRPMKDLCQPDYINSEVCGKRPPYIKDEESFDFFDRLTVRMRWPWLVGLLKREVFACTGAVIAPSHVITAAHCVTRSQETSNQTMHPWDLKIQYMNHNKEVSTNRVISIHLHPRYKSGKRPTNDLAIIKLETRILYSRYNYPACISSNGILNTLDYGVAFQRLEGQMEYFWTVHQHVADTSCYVANDRCDQDLAIRPNEYCIHIKNSNVFLQPGSSGGPYLYNEGNDVNERWSISGIVSYSSDRSCSSNTVVTNVYPFMCWVRNCVQEGDCKYCK